ncbi:MAG TPA: sulfotransferase [Candidatus Sulfopaludibacter sp.]|jgi:hypothetical protein|nr:sulfotransferase [Candidatus Sulfopaludibacter sp.]
MPPRLPNFFLVGAPKAGSTSLYHHLDRHPQIYMSPIKEPCYFSTEIRPHHFSASLQQQVARDTEALDRYLAGPMTQKLPGAMVQHWDDYLRLFAAASDHKAIGEASVCYLWSSTAPVNIRAQIPDAKILIVLRNPVERAFSQYIHCVSMGRLHASLHDHIQASLRNRDPKFSMEFPFLELGRYHGQIQRYRDHFPAASICISFFEDYRDRPRETLATVLRFLNVDDSFVADTAARHLQVALPRNLAAGHYLKSLGIWQRARRLCPPSILPLARRLVHRPRRDIALDPQDRAFLADYYRDDILQLAGLLNRDLSHWLA